MRDGVLRDLSVRRALRHEILLTPPPLAVNRAPRLRNQHSTGQCWLYAGVGLLETFICTEDSGRYVDVIHLYKQFLFMLVQWVSEQLADPALDERTRQHLLDHGISDGASWATFRSIASQPLHLRTFPRRRREWPRAAQDSRELMRVLRSQVRCGVPIPHMHRTIEEFLPDALGDVAMHDASDLLGGYFQIVNAPHLRPNAWYSSYMDPSGTDASYNTTTDVVMDACKAMLRAGRAVWVSVCIDHEFDWERLHAGRIQPHAALVATAHETRVQRIAVRDLRPDHAMLLVGYKDGLWRLHNSWGKRPDEPHALNPIEGDDDGDDDCHDVLATDEWVAMHLFHAVVHADVVTKPAGSHDPVLLPLWDVLSTVAE